jgi:cytochrome b561
VRVVEKVAHASARPPFDTVTITLHWLTAVVVLTLVGSGLLYGLVEDRPWGGNC